MRNVRAQSRGFTLIELIMVLVILAIVAAIVVPTLTAFTLGRNTANTASLIVTLCNYARQQAITEGRPYRLNFDPQAGTIQLTCQDGGAFIPAQSDYGQPFHVPVGVQMDVNLTPQVSAQPILPSDEQPVVNQNVTMISDPTQQPNQLMQSVHQSGLYIEFLPGGRSDTGVIRLSDKHGDLTQVACDSATELFHVRTANETQR